MFGSERLTGALLDPLKRPTVRSIVCPCEAKGHDLAECVTFVAATFSPNQVQLVRHHGRTIPVSANRTHEKLCQRSRHGRFLPLPEQVSTSPRLV